MIDVALVLSGLFLSHMLEARFAESVQKAHYWDHQISALLALSENVSAVTTPAATAFGANEIGSNKDSLENAIFDLNLALAAIKQDYSTPESGEDGSKKAIMGGILDLQAAAGTVAEGSREVIDLVANGSLVKAANVYATVHLDSVRFQARLNNLANEARKGGIASLENTYASALSLKWVEYAIGGGVVIVVFIVLGYGSFLARLMSRNFAELQRAHRQEEAARKEAEANSAELTSLNQQFEAVNLRLNGQIELLDKQRDELLSKGRMEQLGQLTATVAHELRNPLGAVRTSIFVLERRLRGKDLNIEPQLDRINNGVKRCDNIIEQLLDFSRNKKINCVADDLDAWLKKALEEEATKMPSAVSINCSLGLDRLAVPFDPERLHRALINLLSNASEALVGKGDEPAKFTHANPTISVSTQLADNHVIIAVQDNGPGMAPDILARIREPLFTTKSFGTGLGLAAIEQIVAQHDGKLNIESTLGLGSIFSILLPLAIEHRSAA